MEVKMCGITNLEDAKKALQAGVDYLGIILVPGAKRYIEDACARNLIRQLKDYPIHVVGVFMERDFQTLAKRAQELELTWIQIVAPKLKSKLEPLDNFKKFLVVPVNKDGTYTAMSYSLDKGDRWLYDYKSFGEGQKFDWKHFKRIETGPFFVAGGLNAWNVKKAIKVMQPNGVDVSSGICDHTNVRKDPVLMRQLTQNAKGYAKQLNPIRDIQGVL